MVTILPKQHTAGGWLTLALKSIVYDTWSDLCLYVAILPQWAELINMFIVHCSECVHCFVLWNPFSPKSCGNVYAKWWRMHLKCGVCALSSPLITFGRQCHYTHNTWTCPSPDQPLWSSLYPQHMIWFVNPHSLWPGLTKPFDLQRMVCCAWWAKVYHLTSTSTRPVDHFTKLGRYC